MEQALIDLISSHFLCAPTDITITPILQGASGRMIARCHHRDQSAIAIQWTDQRADNHSFIPVAQWLKQQNVQVPQIWKHIDHGNKTGCALVEDLGDDNLLSKKSLHWNAKRPYYISALREVHQLHKSDVPSHFSLQAPFDQDLYTWEQAYFAEHFIGTHLKKDYQGWIKSPYLTQLAETLAQLPKSPIHRDFQSQNIHIRNNKTYLIDFQGLRLGRPEYDLASLLYDPYAELSQSEINDLIDDWEAITGQELNRTVFQACAIQRLMQALGAFANIGHNHQNAWYLAQIPVAWTKLNEVAQGSELAKPLQDLID